MARLLLIIPFVSLCVFVLAALAEEGDREMEARYDFSSWGGRKATGASVFYHNLELTQLLGDEYVVKSRLGRLHPQNGGLWAAYDEATFVRKANGVTGAERPVFKVQYYECRGLLQAHRTLISTMCQGAAPPPPAKCLDGVSVGDKCFTGWAKTAPVTIFFARGNVVVALEGEESVLPAAVRIDERLKSAVPAPLVPCRVCAHVEEGVPAGQKLGTDSTVCKVSDRENESTVISSSQGSLSLDKEGRVILGGATAGDVTVVVTKARQLKAAGGKASGKEE